VYTVLLNINVFLYTPALISSAKYPFSHFIIQTLQQLTGGNPYALAAVFVLMLIVQAIMFNTLVNSNKLFENETNLPAFAYVLLLSMFNGYVFLSAPFLANFALIIALIKVLEAYHNKSFTQPFDAGFAIGIASLFYLPSAVLILFVFVALSIIRVFKWKEWLVTILGFFMPYFILGTVFIVFKPNELDNIITAYLNPNAVNTLPIYYIEIFVKMTVLVSIMLLTMFFFQKQFFKKMVKTRNMLTAFIYLMAISILTFLLADGFSVAPITLTIPSVAVFLSFAFIEIEKEWMNEIIHLAIIAIVLFFSYF
jgi:hypothetical protein